MEVGQELSTFKDEHIKQLEILKNMDLEIVTVSKFTDWYKKIIPISLLKMIVTDGFTTWENTSGFRKGMQDNKIVDFKDYNFVVPYADSFSIDKK